jgi:hypothetical protein
MRGLETLVNVAGEKINLHSVAGIMKAYLKWMKNLDKIKRKFNIGLRDEINCHFKSLGLCSTH